jgi:hypothetical protein
MRSNAVIYAGIASLFVAAAAEAQNRPDFSGVWAVVQETPAPGAPRSPAPPFGAQFTLRQSGEQIAITYPVGEFTLTTTHPLNGNESRSRRPGRLCEADSANIWTAAWEDGAIGMSMVGIVPPGGGDTIKSDLKRVLKLQSPDTMVVETTVRPAGQPPRTLTTSYKRTGPASAETSAAVDTSAVKATIAQVSWIAGTWIGTTGSNTFEERWTPSAGGSMLAMARTIRGGVMSAFEFLCIVEREGGLVYQAMPKLTKIDAESATFENPAHDFPKMIRYAKRPDGSLEAVVGDGKQRAQTFVFKRQE